MHLKTMIKRNLMLAAAAFAGSALAVGDPLALWDGDFSTATKGNVTLSLNGNTCAADGSKVTIAAGTQGLGLGWSAAPQTAASVHVKYSGFARPSSGWSGLGVFRCKSVSDGIAESDHPGVATDASGDTRGLWSTGLWTNGSETHNAFAAGDGEFVIAYGPSSQGITLYQKSGGAWSVVYHSLNLRSSYEALGTADNGILGATVCGLWLSSHADVVAAAGLNIEAVAVYGSYVTESELSTLGFPSNIPALTWKNTADESTLWATTSNWQDKSGAEPASGAPLAKGVKATFPEVDAPFTQVISFGQNYYGSQIPDVEIGSVLGNWRKTLLYGTFVAFDAGSKNCRLTLQDGTGFDGLWRTEAGNTTFVLPTGAEGPRLNRLDAQSRPTVEVGAAKATVGRLLYEGTLAKTGSGDLELGVSPSGDTGVFVKNGDITLTGFPAGADPIAAILAKATLHLDASVESSLVKGTDGDGRTTVTEWRDIRDNGKKATVAAGLSGYGSAYVQPGDVRAPYLDTAAKSPTGFPMIDFGSEDGASGPVGCVLGISRVNARHAVYAFKRKGALWNGRAVLSSSNPANNGWESTWECLYAGGELAGVKNGVAAYDGALSKSSASPAWGPSGKWYTDTNVHVMSLATSEAAGVDIIGCDRYIKATCGGQTIGEIILFETELTLEERELLDGYLLRKWKHSAPIDGATEPWAAGSLELADGASITVPEGRVAYVPRLVLNGAATKKGAGTLKVGMIFPAGASLVVAAGTVEGAAMAAKTADTAPAEGHCLWLDATDETSMTLSGNSVTRWNDKDGGSMYAVNGGSSAPVPTLNRNSFGGRNTVDFSASYLKYSNYGARSAYATFMVVRPKAASTAKNLFGSSTAEFMRWGSSNYGMLANDKYAQPQVVGAKFRVNGAPVDPLKPIPEMQQTADFFVVGFSSTKPVYQDCLFLDRGNSYGGYELAECIVYDRPISEDEARQTEAYLLKRWFGRTAPENSGAQLAAYEAGGVTRVVFGGEDGETTISEPLQSVSVSGAQAVRFRYDYAPGAAYVLDAARTATMTLQVDGAKTNILRWADAHGNGVEAQSVKVKYPDGTSTFRSYTSSPTLQIVDTAVGTMPVVDFGVLLTNAGYDADPKGKHTSAGFFFKSTQQVCDVFTVWQDNNNSGSTFGRFTSPAEDGDISLLRFGSGYIFHTWACDAAKNGYIAIDGETKAYTSPYPSGMHVLSTCYQNGTKLNIGIIGGDRDCEAGGGMICEQIAFSTPLSGGERTKLEQYLAAKWTGALACPVSAAGVAFDFGFDAEGNLGRVDYEGVLDFADGVTFNFSFANLKAVPKSTRLPFLRVAGLRGFDAAKVTVAGSLAGRRNLVVEKDGDTLYLTVGPKGFVLLAR